MRKVSFTVVVVYINTMKMNLDLNFDFYQAFKQHKMENKEKLPINSFSLVTHKLSEKLSAIKT